MLTLGQLKEALGEEAVRFSSDQLEELRLFCDRFTELVLSDWLMARIRHNINTNDGQY